MGTAGPFSKLSAILFSLRAYGFPRHGLIDQFYNTMHRMPPECKQKVVGYPLNSHTTITPPGTPCLVSCSLQALQLGKNAYDFSFLVTQILHLQALGKLTSREEPSSLVPA